MIDNEKYSLTLPGRIVAFNATDQTAEVQICVERIFSSSLAVSTNKVRKPIKGIPVHVVQGGGWSHTFPISVGETCQVSFSQVGYDHWLFEDKDTAGTLDNVPKPWLKRHFSEDDGFCLVGYNTLPRAITGFSGTNSEWRNSDASQIIRLLPSNDIEIETTTKVAVISPTVHVQCENSIVDATAKAEVTAPVVEVTALTGCKVTTPILDLICATAVNITSPLVAQSGNMTVGGSLLVGLGLGSGGTITATEVIGGGKSLSTHEHAGDGGTGSGSTTGGPL